MCSLLSTDGLSWYIQDVAKILSTKIVKKKFDGSTDRGENLVFQNYMHSWVCYDLVKIMYMFGLQPTINANLSDWYQDLSVLFKYFSNKKQHIEEKNKATDLLDILLNRTEHTSYFSKLPFGSKQKFLHFDKPILFLVVLTYLRQLQQYFYDPEYFSLDWNKYGKYCGVPTGNNENGLEFVHMSKYDNDEVTQIKNFSYFKPYADIYPEGVVLSLEEWAARILKPSIFTVQKKAIESDSDTKKRLERASNPKVFKLSTIDFGKESSITSKEKKSPNKKKSPTTLSDAEDIVDPTSTNTFETQTSNSIDDLNTITSEFRSIAVAIEYALQSSTNNKLSKQKKQDIVDGSNCFLALVNKNLHTKYSTFA
jgi:hypothetical protein